MSAAKLLCAGRRDAGEERSSNVERDNAGGR
jgi:hypothetical protein